MKPLIVWTKFSRNRYALYHFWPLKQRVLDYRHTVGRVSHGRSGFRKKDKSGEKLAESEEDRIGHYNDYSDAFDALYI